jgi:hypothetical protein
MNTTELITPPAARDRAGHHASRSLSEPTFAETVAEINPLIGAVPVEGPPVLLVLGPWIFLALMVAGPFAFLVVLVVAIVLSFVQPSVFLGVLAGLAVALLCALLPYGPLGKRARIVLAAVALVVVIIVLVAVLSGGSKHSQLPPTRSIQLGTTFKTTGHYDSKKKSLDVTDTLTIDGAELTKAVNTPLLSPNNRRGLTARKFASALTAGLRSQGWQQTGTPGSGVTATRKRTFKVMQHTVVPGLSENMLPVAKPTKFNAALPGASGVQALPISFAIVKGSLVLDGPRYAIATTKPSSDAKSMPNDRESRTITLEESTRQVTYDVRSEAFRSSALAKVTDVTKWAGFKWLVALVLALSNGAVRERVRRLVTRESRAKANA